MSEQVEEPRRRHRLSGTGGGWWASFAVLFALGGLWSLAIPLFGAPDEPSHAVRAASLARGQLRGPERTPPNRPTVTDVQVPELFDKAHKVPKCFLRRPGVTPACAPPLAASDRLVTSSTYMGRYPPGYHLVVGLPSRWTASPLGMHLMRLVSAAASAALLASALATARAGRSGALAVGLALAVTPTALFLAGSVNPNGLEIAAAIGLWVSLVALATGETTSSTKTLAVRAAVAGSVLANSRQLGPVWLVVAVSVVALATGRPRLRELARDAAVRRAALAVTAFTALAVTWNLLRDAFGGYGDPRGPQLSTARFALTSLGRTGDNLLQMVGVFGWTDTRSPLATYAVWFAGLACLSVLALARARRREVAALALLAAVVVAVPVAGETSQHIGFYWLGRYTLPAAVGAPILACAFCWPWLGRFAERVRMAVVGAVVAAHFLSFVWAIRRFTVGVGRSGPPTWAPPVPVLVLVMAFALAAALYGARLARPAAGAGGSGGGGGRRARGGGSLDRIAGVGALRRVPVVATGGRQQHDRNSHGDESSVHGGGRALPSCCANAPKPGVCRDALTGRFALG